MIEPGDVFSLWVALGRGLEAHQLGALASDEVGNLYGVSTAAPVKAPDLRSSRAWLACSSG